MIGQKDVAALFRMTAAAILLTLCAAVGSRGQDKQPLECRERALAALRPIPKLKYRCNGDSESDEKFLKLPNRLAALRAYERRLSVFVYPDWWATPVDDLNTCELH